MDNIGKEVDITQDKDYLSSVGIYGDIIDFKGVLEREHPEYSQLKVKIKYPDMHEVLSSNILIHNDKFKIVEGHEKGTNEEK